MIYYGTTSVLLHHALERFFLIKGLRVAGAHAGTGRAHRPNSALKVWLGGGTLFWFRLLRAVQEPLATTEVNSWMAQQAPCLAAGGGPRSAPGRANSSPQAAQRVATSRQSRAACRGRGGRRCPSGLHNATHAVMHDVAM